LFAKKIAITSVVSRSYRTTLGKGLVKLNTRVRAGMFWRGSWWWSKECICVSS